jgi:hypothetical protein
MGNEAVFSLQCKKNILCRRKTIVQAELYGKKERIFGALMSMYFEQMKLRKMG